MKSAKILFLFSLLSSLYAKNITIGTGSTSGIYYPTGQNICKIVNENQKK